VLCVCVWYVCGVGSIYVYGCDVCEGYGMCVVCVWYVCGEGDMYVRDVICMWYVCGVGGMYVCGMCRYVRDVVCMWLCVAYMYVLCVWCLYVLCVCVCVCVCLWYVCNVGDMYVRYDVCVCGVCVCVCMFVVCVWCGWYVCVWCVYVCEGCGMCMVCVFVVCVFYPQKVRDSFFFSRKVCHKRPSELIEWVLRRTFTWP